MRSAAVAWALFCLWLALQCFIDLSMAGFPDGYITPYAAATKLPLEVLAWLTVAQSLYFLFRGLAGRTLKFASLVLQIVLAGLLTLMPIEVVRACPRWDACSQAYQTMTGTMMDDGAGG